MTTKINSKMAREKLKPRHQPYWHQLRAGAHVGYRAVDQGDGTWCAKWRDPQSGKRFQKSLGTIVERGGLRAFDEAVKLADKWFREIERGVVPHALTVRDACERHIKALRAKDGDTKADAEDGRFKRLVYEDKLARVELSRLRKADLEGWRQRVAAKPAKVSRHKKAKRSEIIRERAPATVNRDIVPLRAALNRALDDELVSGDLAWRVALRPTKNADRRRDIYLDRDEQTRLLEAAGDEIRPFLRGLTLLPLLPGALAALTVGDFDARLKTLRVGRDKAGADRRIKLPEKTAAFLVEQGKSKLPSAPIFADSVGRAWSKDAWKIPIKAAVVAVGLPRAATAYTLRHSVITDLVTGGLPALTVAQISGTSLVMIERHYGHLQQEQAAAALARLGLDLAQPVESGSAA